MNAISTILFTVVCFFMSFQSFAQSEKEQSHLCDSKIYKLINEIKVSYPNMTGLSVENTQSLSYHKLNQIENLKVISVSQSSNTFSVFTLCKDTLTGAQALCYSENLCALDISPMNETVKNRIKSNLALLKLFEIKALVAKNN